MKPVNLRREEFWLHNSLDVEVGTNCPQGGNHSHGGRTVLRLTDLGSTAMQCAVDDEPLRDVSRIEIVFGGDSECVTLIQALEYATRVLRKQTGNFVSDWESILDHGDAA
jgi:hypothetical protein